MAITVRDNRTVLYSDGLTNVTGASTSEITFFAEATGCAAEAYNEATGQIFWSGTTPNFTTTGNELIYVWSAIVATQNSFKEATPLNSSHAMYLSDGVDDLLIYQSGNDRAVFKHSETQVSFECFLIDIDYIGEASKNGELDVTAGSLAAFDSTSTTMDVGAHYTTLSKALGGGNNCYMDIIRYGGQAQGIQLAGGTAGDPGNFSQAAAIDRLDSAGRAHGIIREYTPGAYGVQGTLRIGDSAGATRSSYFTSENESITFEDRLVSDDKFAIFTDANATGTNEVRLTNTNITSARPGVTIDMSDSNMNVLSLNGVAINSTRRLITFPRDTVTNSLSHTVSGCSFINTDQIDPGTVTFSNNNIVNYDPSIQSGGAASGDGALLLDSDGSSTWSNLRFETIDSGHAIVITATGTYNFTNFTYEGYDSSSIGSNLVAGTGSTSAMVYNNSGGAVVINIVDGDTPSVRNGTGATTTVNNNISITVTGLKDNTEVRVYDTSTLDNTPPYSTPTELAGIEIATDGSIDNRSFTFSVAAGTGLTIRTFNTNWTAADVTVAPTSSGSIPIAQQLDRVYTNP